MGMLDRITQYFKDCYARTDLKRLGKLLVKGVPPALCSLFGGFCAGPIGAATGGIIGTEVGKILSGDIKEMQEKNLVGIA